MRSKLIVVLAAALALATAASAMAAVKAPGTASAAQAPAKVTVKSSCYGKVLSDARGYALYLFDKDKGKSSTWYGGCAKAWPPFLTKGKPTAAPGVNARLLGTTRRHDGSLQVTYAGHPLYYYEGDGKGEVKCQNVSNFGGLWRKRQGRALGEHALAVPRPLLFGSGPGRDRHRKARALPRNFILC